MHSRSRLSACRLAGSLVLALGVALLALVPLVSAQADAGPKPGMTFVFEFEGNPIEIISGQLIECDDSTCADGQPLESMGPQRFYCDADQCHSTAYTYADYHRIVIEFADRTRESNVFAKTRFRAGYRVTVLDTSLLVSEDPSVAGFPCPSASMPLLAAGLALCRACRPKRRRG